MIEVLAGILSTPISLLTAISFIPLWFLFDVIFRRKPTNINIVFNLMAGAVFIYLAYGGNLTVGLGLILTIPLSILSSILAKVLFKEEPGDGNN